MSAVSNFDSVRAFLIEAGMPQEKAHCCKIQEDEEGNLAITFRLEWPKVVCYLKFQDKEGARGGPFIKHLLPINDPSMRDHAVKRRRFMRQALESVQNHRSTLVPAPLFFDLSPVSMQHEKAKEKSRVFAELRVEQGEPRLVGMVGTLWSGLEIDHLPTSPADQRDVWNPISYAPKVIFLCTAAIGELQTKMNCFVERKVRDKTPTQAGYRKKLAEKLKHEQRALVGYECLQSGLQKMLKAQTLVKEVEQLCRQEFGNPSIEECKGNFLKTVRVPEKMASLPFHKQVYLAENEGWWLKKVINEGKRLAQLDEAQRIAQTLQQSPKMIQELFDFVVGFKEAYLAFEELPHAVVPQDGHPFNFFTNRADGKVSMLDLEDLSWGVRFADLSTVYLYKILRAYDRKQIETATVKDLIQATIEGYNSQVETPLSNREIQGMANYTIAVFLNHLQQLDVILDLNKDVLNHYNLAFTLDDFLDRLNMLRRCSEMWMREFVKDLQTVN